MEIITNNNEVLYNRSRGSEVCTFYEGLNVFITGGTGFMGKVLVEKLLRTTNVATIYMLVRKKKGKDMYERLDEIFEDVVFDRLKKEVNKFRHRVVPISGDCALPALGLSIQDRQTLIATVDVVFHVAATVRFDEKLKPAYDINVRGTTNVLDLCKEINNLKSLIHVSTAYSNCHLQNIDEVFYDYPMELQNLGLLLDKLDEEEAEEITPKLLDKWPNTYAFTKALAEEQVRKKCNGLPVGVFRPAIVVSTYTEPMEGWIDNLYGPTGVVAGAGMGILRTLHADPKSIANIVPVDMCVSALICSAWDVASRTYDRIPENVPIYNYVSSVDNPITWDEYCMINIVYGNHYPFNNSVWTVNFRITPNGSVNLFYKIAYHFLPAILVDFALLCCAQKPTMLGVYKKIHKYSHVISYFSVRNWEFTNDNTNKLWSKLSPRDRELFPMNIKDLCWMRYFRKYLLGIRQYLMKDPITSVQKAKKKQSRLKFLHNLLKYTFLFVASNLLWTFLFTKISQTISQSQT